MHRNRRSPERSPHRPVYDFIGADADLSRAKLLESKPWMTTAHSGTTSIALVLPNPSDQIRRGRCVFTSSPLRIFLSSFNGESRRCRSSKWVVGSGLPNCRTRPPPSPSHHPSPRVLDNRCSVLSISILRVLLLAMASSVLDAIGRKLFLSYLNDGQRCSSVRYKSRYPKPPTQAKGRRGESEA